MNWTEFLDRRAVRLARARVLALQLPAVTPDALALLGGWSFVHDDRLRETGLHALSKVDFQADPGLIAAALAPPEVLRPPAEHPPELAERLLRRHVARAGVGAPGSATPAGEARVWALDELAFLGEEIERLERRAWRAESYPTSKDDARAARLWRSWFTQGYADEDAWRALVLPTVKQTFAGILEARRVPMDRRSQILDELEEGLLFQMLGDAEDLAGWLEVAARVIETGGDGPLAALTQVNLPSGLDRLSRCAAGRGAWAGTLQDLWSARHEGGARAAELRRVVSQRPVALEALLDLHIWLRLLRLWAEPGSGAPETSWAVVAQNRGRARGRLRAVAALDARERVQEILLQLPGLHSRTRAAMARYAWAWGMGQLRLSFSSLGGAADVTPACRDVSLESAFSMAEAAAAQTWVLLVVLRGQLDPLREWTERGRVEGSAATFYRLLQEQLPSDLLDAGASRGAYHRLRSWLHDALDACLADWLPVLGDIAALPSSARDLKDRVLRRLRPVWDDAIAQPASGFPSICQEATAAFQQLRSVEVEEHQ